MKDELTIPNTIEVVLVDQNQPAETWGIIPTVKAFQSLVKGDIILHTLADGIVAVTNAEAMIIGLPVNVTVDGVDLCGPVVFTKVKDGKFVALDPVDRLDIKIKIKEARLARMEAARA